MSIPKENADSAGMPRKGNRMKPNAKRTCIGVAVALFWIFSAICLPPVLAFLLFAVAVCLAVIEYTRLVQARGIPGLSGPLVVATLVWLCCVFWGGGEAHLQTLFPLMLGCIVLALSCRVLFDSRIERPFETIAFAVLGFTYLPVCMSYLLCLAQMGDCACRGSLSAQGLYAVLYLVAVVKACDIGAFAVGTLCGRHKMFPRVSPAKSWEGLVGGIALSVLASLGLTLVAQRVSAGGIVAPLGLLGAALMGALLALLGVLGDLIESLFKRAAKIKDSGGLFKGMGGLLDTFDSLIFAAPVCYAILLWSLR